MTRTTTLRKVMTAAWTIFRKGGVTFSQALTKAWAWAKKTATEARIWSPKAGFWRIYLGEGYLQISLGNRRTRDGYTAYTKHVGLTEQEGTDALNAVGFFKIMLSNNISHLEASKF
jgi:hypothetical protein